MFLPRRRRLRKGIQAMRVDEANTTGRKKKKTETNPKLFLLRRVAADSRPISEAATKKLFQVLLPLPSPPFVCTTLQDVVDDKGFKKAPCSAPHAPPLSSASASLFFVLFRRGGGREKEERTGLSSLRSKNRNSHILPSPSLPPPRHSLPPPSLPSFFSVPSGLFSPFFLHRLQFSIGSLFRFFGVGEKGKMEKEEKWMDGNFVGEEVAFHEKRRFDFTTQHFLKVLEGNRKEFRIEHKVSLDPPLLQSHYHCPVVRSTLGLRGSHGPLFAPKGREHKKRSGERKEEGIKPRWLFHPWTLLFFPPNRAAAFSHFPVPILLPPLSFVLFVRRPLPPSLLPSSSYYYSDDDDDAASTKRREEGEGRAPLAMQQSRHRVVVEGGGGRRRGGGEGGFRERERERGLARSLQRVGWLASFLLSFELRKGLFFSFFSLSLSLLSNRGKLRRNGRDGILALAKVQRLADEGSFFAFPRCLELWPCSVAQG